MKYFRKLNLFSKKIQNKRLCEIFQQCFEKIRLNPPEVGEAKIGDLKDLYTYKFRYQKTDYRIGYRVKQNEDGTLSIIIMIGKCENFYKDFKNYIN